MRFSGRVLVVRNASLHPKAASTKPESGKHKNSRISCVYTCALRPLAQGPWRRRSSRCVRGGGVGWGHTSLSLSLSLSLARALSLSHTRDRALYLSRGLPWGFSEANACRKDSSGTTTRLRRVFTIYSQKLRIKDSRHIATHLCCDPSL